MRIFPVRKSHVFLCLVSCLALSGCEMMNQPAPQPAPTTTLEYKLPILTPVEPTKQDQEKEGIRISVAGYSYIPKRVVHRQFKRVPSILIVNNQYPVQVREIPSLVVSPKEVRFKVKIYNRLERVLRLAGAVVQFQVAGKTIAVNRAGYNDFLNGIILPRQEGEYEVSGPDLATLPDNATIAFFIYDIVTETDAAGNATKRSNFEFIYSLSKQTKTEDAQIGVRQMSLNPQEAQWFATREQNHQGQWISVPELDRNMNGQR